MVRWSGYRPIGLCLAVGSFAILPTDASAQSTTPQGAQQTCEVSTDPEYALTLQKPAEVGGGAVYAAARERRYLETLRGPKGEPISFQRVGSTRAPGREGPVDHWTVTYDGLAKPISVFIDAYHFSDPRAPVGFSCVPFALGPPPIDAVLANELLARLAVEQGGTRDFTPIPLGPDGATSHGIAFDRFRVIALVARASVLAGAPIDPKNVPQALARAGLTLVAYPLKCADRIVAPVSIAIVSTQGAPVPTQRGPIGGADLPKILPGAALPEGAVATIFQVATLRASDTVQITYANETCDGTSKEVTLKPSTTPARGVTMPQPTLPPGMAATNESIWLQVLVDLEGRLQQASYIGGPQPYVEAAIAAIREWRAEPARLNGAPIVSDTLVVLRFK